MDTTQNTDAASASAAAGDATEHTALDGREPQLIRSRVANACDGCKARKGMYANINCQVNTLFLSLPPSHHIGWSRAAPLRLVPPSPSPSPSPSPLPMAAPYLRAAWPMLHVLACFMLCFVLHFHMLRLGKLMPLPPQSNATATCRAATVPVARGLIPVNTRRRDNVAILDRGISLGHRAYTRLLRLHMAGTTTTPAATARLCRLQRAMSTSLRASPPRRPRSCPSPCRTRLLSR